MSIPFEKMKVSEVIMSEVYVEVRRRIFRQLVESLLFEKIVSADEIEVEEGILFRIQGVDGHQSSVTYECLGRRSLTFGRIRLTEPMMRVAQEGFSEAESFALFFYEVGKNLGINQEKQHTFIQELEQTLLKDTLAQYKRRQQKAQLLGTSYDDLEGNVMDAHPYHPSYKSRIGFTLMDNERYGPESKNRLKPIWLALHQDVARVAVMEGESYSSFLRSELGEKVVRHYDTVVRSHGCDPQSYFYLPVHPWQWENYIIPHGVDQIRKKHLIYLGVSEEDYSAQQSIRTLANVTHPQKAYLKTALHIVNTSSVRHLHPYSIASAPVISAWLEQMVQGDVYLREEARLVLLKEYAGVCYDPPSECVVAPQALYGAIGCIWRESIHPYLEPGEEAIPFNALYSRELDGNPLIHSWVQKHGLEQWVRHLVRTCIWPVVHLLVAHGVALESHAQNMIFIHREGKPERVALKDFHEGVEYYTGFLKEPQACPDFSEIHDRYKQGALNDFFEMENIDLVREMTLDALFSMNLGELSFLLADFYRYEEDLFWSLVAESLQEYAEAFPQLKARFQEINLFVPSCRLEQLTKRRLYTDEGLHLHEVPNPLYQVQEMFWCSVSTTNHKEN
ncbi:IucA/IucC family protein [Caldalkalibacillus mannanilyticus]|uniref:IucA/IucC family protein n=1 Tax=Caldalkalibacillus mannanilyticus TaxID=1418 RepID=UPI000468FFFE|nr:IucA/IucC family protein [Caldalkalibacillus mannanilyticus]